VGASTGAGAFESGGATTTVLPPAAGSRGAAHALVARPASAAAVNRARRATIARRASSDIERALHVISIRAGTCPRVPAVCPRLTGASEGSARRAPRENADDVRVAPASRERRARRHEAR